MTDPRIDFLHWARGALVSLPATFEDLRALAGMIGESPLVMLGEPLHGSEEPLALRNALITELVESHQLTAVALESGIAESRWVHDYVLGGSAEAGQVIAQGLSWTFDRFARNHALVHWLRQHNTDARPRRKVNFYGFDVPGSPGNSEVASGLDVALTETLRYIFDVDSYRGRALHARIEPLFPRLRFDFSGSAGLDGYEHWSRSERDALTAVVADAIELMKVNGTRYRAATSDNEYEWACRAALGARQTELWLREISPSNRPDGVRDAREAVVMAAGEVRERAQADNLAWIIGRESPLGKVLIFGHTYHLAKAAVKPSRPGASGRKVAGAYLTQTHNQEPVAIAIVVGTNSLAGEEQGAIWPSKAVSLEGSLKQVSEGCFALDLRSAPTSVRHWLECEQCIGSGDGAMTLPVGRAFDVLIYLDAVTPAQLA